MVIRRKCPSTIFEAKFYSNKLKRITIVCISLFIALSVLTTFRITQRVHFEDYEQGFPDPPEPLTIHCNGGRLGNQMCSYASLYGVSVLNNRSIKLLHCNYDHLIQYFDIQTPVLNSSTFKERNPYDIGTFLHKRDFFIPRNSNIIKGYYYPCSYTFFDHVRDAIKQKFRFRPEIQRYAEEVLRNASSSRKNITFVGVHVRRTDFLISIEGRNAWLKAFDGKEVDFEYFEKATEYYRHKYKNVLFLAISDDRKWCRENLVKFGIHVTEESPGPAHDMAIFSNCNHTIMTYGTFGFWGSYLAGGEVVYFKNFLKPGTQFSTYEFIQDKMYLPEWVGIATKNTWSISARKQQQIS